MYFTKYSCVLQYSTSSTDSCIQISKSQQNNLMHIIPAHSENSASDDDSEVSIIVMK